MNFASAMLLNQIEQLEKTIKAVSPNQRQIIEEMKLGILEQGKYFPVADLTVELMREHGYDVTEKDSGEIEHIANLITMNEEELWGAVEIYAEKRLKQMNDDRQMEREE
ncbi:hypothetical protein DW228_06485 [Bacteroides fragilis]|uniref:Uncharacterized protein n=1 Tax=Bacteroides fragilis TaxID=817 RepID=A0A396C6X1_BACFG|nr:hypothetical protein [Bacteroides fragilis]RHH14444.1 hypothetical protein DW228_06485 [Bacteroides fragilis]